MTPQENPARRGGAELAAIYTVFLVSGAASLIYQTIWIRQFSLLMGGTVNAMSVVVCTFMAGLAVGAALLGRLADRTAHPLRLYAALEAGIAGFALVLMATEDARTQLLSMLVHTADLPGTMPQRVLVAAVSLGVPCMLMGGTLPVMVRHIVRSMPQLGRQVGTLYFVNTLGAAFGALATGVVLVETLGLSGSTWLALAMNVTAAAAALWLGRRGHADTAEARSADPPTAAASPGMPWVPAAAFFVSGFCALMLEITWTRVLLGFVFNGALIISINLFMVLVGFAIGGAAMARAADTTAAPRMLAGVLFLTVATFTLVGLGSVELLGLLPAAGYVPSWGHVMAIGGLQLPACIAMGAAFPVLVRVLVRDHRRLGAQLGAYYALNTVGTVVGGLAAPFVFIPLVGTTNTVMVVCGLQVLMGTMLCLGRQKATGNLPRIAVALGVTAAVLAPLHRDIYHRTLTAVAKANIPHWSLERAYVEGPDSTVMLFQSDDVGAQMMRDNNRFRIQVNASTLVAFDTNETKLMAHLPLMAVSHPHRALVICFGMGNTFRSALAHGIDVDVVDINAAVPDLARIHQEDPDATFNNPRGVIHINDGRNYLQLTTNRYDMITIDPAPPLWGLGLGNIQSLEFYQLMAARLSDQGVAEAWMLSDTRQDFLASLAAFRQAFPYVQVFRGAKYVAFHVLGSKQPIRFTKARLAHLHSDPELLADLGETDITFFSPDLLNRLYVTNQDGVDQVIAGVAPLTDDRPVLEYRTLRGIDKDPFVFPPEAFRPFAQALAQESAPEPSVGP